ncbi:MAG: rhodanese-like domain-containing protein [Woeseiaceae bacterium]
MNKAIDINDVASFVPIGEIMKSPTIAVLLASIAVSGCATTGAYNFRDQNRPAYENTISVNELNSMRSDPKLTLLDVRLFEDYKANPTLIPGARYMDPENIETWSSAVPDESKVVVYCVKGKWVSQKAANYLTEQGIETYSLEGGIEAWQQAQ